MSDIDAPIDSLLGVFLGPGQPDTNAPPAALDFSTPASTDFSMLNSQLQQVFFISAGLRLNGVTQQFFIVPDGATRLFLGTMDGFDCNNNVGSLDVTVTAVPEPQRSRSWLWGTGRSGATQAALEVGRNRGNPPW